MIKRFFKGVSKKDNYKEELEKRLDSEESDEENFDEEDSVHSIDNKSLEASEYMQQFEEKKKRYLQKQISREKERKERFRQTGRIIPPSTTPDPEEGSTTTSEKEKTPVKSSRQKASAGLHAEGTLLNIEDLGIGIYKERIPQKGYDIVYILLPDKVSVQGIFLNMYRREIIGKLPPYVFKEIQKTHKWNPEQITAYFSDEKYTYLLPCTSKDLKAVPVQSEKSQKVDSPSEILRTIPFGQKLIFKMGDKAWEAIYWTKDEIGHVVAHNTNGHWQLMHLDLKRFQKMNMLQFGAVLPEDELKKIHDYIKYHGD